MVNLAIAYGAKGIFFYPYGTDSLSTFSGCSPAWTVGLVSQERDANGYPFHNNNEATFTGISHAVYTGYKEKWDAVKSINTDLLTLGPVFVNLKWKSAFTSGNVPNEGAPSGSVVTSISGGDYIEAANFDSTGYDSYIMLVNRKCDLNDVQTVTVNTNKTGNWILDDQLTHELFVSSNGVFKEVKLNPGQGRLFRVRAMTTNETWSGTINVSNAITIANGSTLTIQPSATLKFSSAASLIINGKIVASSTNPSQRITFTGATQTPGFWNGITINASAAPNVLRRCDVQYAATGISINYTGNTDSVRVEKCKIRYHSDDGLFITGANYSSATVHPLIKDNSISNNVYGFELYDYAKPTITGNRIENNTSSGIFADSNCNAKVEYNYISGNGQYGSWFVISSNANVHRNTITSNSSRGIACASNSNLIANGSGNTKGRNKITNNSGVGIYASSSSPNFGISPNGYNWVQSNSSYEVQQTGSSNQVQIENCYWGGGAPGAGEISGNVDYSFYATTTPDPVGWGFSDTYDPTLRILRGQDSIIVALPFNDGQYVMLAKSGVTTTAGIINWTTDLQAAIDAGRKTGDWSAASALITALHIELQNARVPDVDFTLVNAYANDLTVAAFIRKMLALALMENDLAANNVSAALVKLTAFAQSNSANTAEFLINAGAIHLYRQNDVAAAQNVLARLQALAKNNDPAAIENAEAFGRILASYQRRNAAAANAAPKQMLASAQVLALPENAALAQNYPNPFNPETTIRFRLDEPQKVRLVIFDITGQRVRVLVNSELPAGEQAISWDGRDEYGKNAASGIYFYELAVGKKVEHKKMTLLR
jgi:parallel beta-helix repeat protein